MIGCSGGLPPSPGVKYLHSANPYEAVDAVCRLDMTDLFPCPDSIHPDAVLLSTDGH